MSTGFSRLRSSWSGKRGRLFLKRLQVGRQPGRWFGVAAAVLATLFTGNTGKAVGAAPVAPPVPVLTTCTSWAWATNGTPELSAVPAITEIALEPSSGGLVVSVRFAKAIPPAPEGVYFAWDVYMFRERADAVNPGKATLLQIEDRGKGWEPTGWTLLESTYQDNVLLREDIVTDTARDQLLAYFPTAVGNVKGPFFWYASQEAYRVYLPDGSGPRWDIYGSLAAYCPPGVEADPYTPPVPAKLLES